MYHANQLLSFIYLILCRKTFKQFEISLSIIQNFIIVLCPKDTLNGKYFYRNYYIYVLYSLRKLEERSFFGKCNR